MKVACVVGTRPNLVKIAPLMAAFDAVAGFEPVLIHTGQHYDHHMSGVFFEQLGIRAPDYNLEIGSDTATRQTSQIMLALEPLFAELRPQLALVVGDVNSTLAAALVAVQRGIPVAHVEAGLRSFDRTMPEEINRVLTDAIADLLFTTERSASANLAREGIDSANVFFVGNVMIDSLLRQLEPARGLEVPKRLGVRAREFAVLTLHRPANVDVAEALAGVMSSVAEVQSRIPLIFPVHPRTRDRLLRFGLWKQLHSLPQLTLTDPLGYRELLSLVIDARVVLTDSGGLQEETTALGVPCLTLRDSTERPVTLTEGTNRLVGSDPMRIVEAVSDVLAKPYVDRPNRPELWDGHAAGRIVNVLRARA